MLCCHSYVHSIYMVFPSLPVPSSVLSACSFSRLLVFLLSNGMYPPKGPKDLIFPVFMLLFLQLYDHVSPLTELTNFFV